MIDRLVFHVRRRRALFIAAFVSSACGTPDSGEPTESFTQALDVCGEMVPANRAVDGLPAYAQCDATMNSSIWSNNGVDTSLTSLGDDWVQTQRSGGYQCTELAYRYMRFRWDVSYRSGDAQEWCDGDLPDNLVKTTTPVHGDLIVFAGGVCGAAESTGHIAVIDTVDAARATVTIVEENRAGRRSTEQSCATCFLHATANDGSVGGAAGTSGMAGMGGTATGTGGVAMGGSGGSAGTAGRSGPGGGGMGAAAGEPGSAGVAGESMGGSSSAGAPGLGGTSGSDSTAGGSPAIGGASNSSGAAGATAAAGAPETAGASGAFGDPAVDESALESGCSISARRSAERGSRSLGMALCLLVGVLARRRATRAFHT
jgi:hypothetical protein